MSAVMPEYVSLYREDLPRNAPMSSRNTAHGSMASINSTVGGFDRAGRALLRVRLNDRPMMTAVVFLDGSRTGCLGTTRGYIVRRRFNPVGVRTAMKIRACFIACMGLASWGASACLAQERSGPATLESLLDARDRLPVNPSPDDSGQSRQPVPNQDAISDARELIRQAFEDDYQTAPENPEPLIQRLLAAAGQTTDPARKYAMLLEAEWAAANGGDHGRAMELIDIRSLEFAEDAIQLRVERLAGFLTPKVKTDPDALVSLYGLAIETAEQGMRQGSFQQAKAAAEMAASIGKSLFLAGKSRKSEGVAEDGEAKQSMARSLVNEVERRRKSFAEYQRAVDALRAQDDPSANGVVGRYLCFEVGDWERGLAYLAKGDQKQTADLAAMELALRSAGKLEARQLFDLAGRWWGAAEAAEKEPSQIPESAAVRQEIKRRAASLYRDIVGQMRDPLEIALADTRAKYPNGEGAEGRLDRGSRTKPNSTQAGATRETPNATRKVRSGQTVSFDYSTQNGLVVVGAGAASFGLKFSKASDTSIHVYKDHPSLVRVARVKGAAPGVLIRPRDVDSSSRVYTIQEQEIFLAQNQFGHWLQARISSIMDDSRQDDHDRVTFEYVIYPAGQEAFPALPVRGP